MGTFRVPRMPDSVRIMKEESPERKDQSAQSVSGAAKAEVEDFDLVVVAGMFSAKPGKEEPLAYALARYVVLSRMEDGCRNIDLVSSVTVPGLLMVWEKWESHDDREAHFRGEAATEMADAVRDLVREPPQFDIFDAISAHDLV